MGLFTSYPSIADDLARKAETLQTVKECGMLEVRATDLKSSLKRLASRSSYNGAGVMECRYNELVIFLFIGFCYNHSHL